MDDIYRFIGEALRIRRTIQVFSELFESAESIDVLSKNSIEVAFILKRSMHDEILISLSRLYDSAFFKNGGVSIERLSQLNLLEKYSASVTAEISALRAETKRLWEEVSIKNYRDLRVAHNDKAILIGKSPPIKHNISFESAIMLSETSITLMIKLIVSISGNSQVPLQENIEEKYIGKGKAFVARFRT